MSDSSSGHHEEEFLMSTRKRRSNAGNKMKRLLEQELEDVRSKTEQLNADELDLLFQEDAEDEDFENNNASSEHDDTQELEVALEGNDEDMIFSESEDESTDQGEEDGENALQNQEKLNKRRRMKRKAPVVIRRKPVTSASDRGSQFSKTKIASELLKAESLLISNRRTSKRSSVVANKLEVYEKLSQAEKKRKIIQERIKKHKELQKEEILTQADRMRMALETEKLNLLSLNKYKEQEVSKKQSRLAFQQRQKMKFKPGETVLRRLATTWTVTPLMEIEDKNYWDEQLKKREKRKKKYPRKQQRKQSPESTTKVEESKSTQKKEEPEKKEVAPNITQEDSLEGKIGTRESPVTTSSEQDPGKVSNEELKKENIDKIIDNEEASEVHLGKPLSDHSITEGNSDLADSKVQSSKLNAEKECNSGHSESLNLEGQSGLHSMVSLTKEGGFSKDADLKSLNNCDSEVSRDVQPKLDASSTILKQDEDVEKVNIQRNIDAKSSSEYSVNEREENAQQTSEELDSDIRPKQVSFIEQPQITLINSNDTPSVISASVPTTGSPITDQGEEENIEMPDMVEKTENEEAPPLEGPAQLVSKNFVTLYTFSGDACNVDIRNELFGTQWSSAANQRSSNVETICKLSMSQDVIGLAEKSHLSLDLSFLEDFPAFGEYGKKVIHNIGTGLSKELEIEIKTSPPSGVFLPNGVRKKCLITNKDCQYFDPKNGVPYSDVEAYKIIQELQDPVGTGTEDDLKPHFQWFGFANGGIYLDVRQKPAKGVPEGF